MKIQKTVNIAWRKSSSRPLKYICLLVVNTNVTKPNWWRFWKTAMSTLNTGKFYYKIAAIGAIPFAVGSGFFILIAVAVRKRHGRKDRRHSSSFWCSRMTLCVLYTANNVLREWGCSVTCRLAAGHFCRRRIRRTAFSLGDTLYSIWPLCSILIYIKYILLWQWLQGKADLHR